MGRFSGSRVYNTGYAFNPQHQPVPPIDRLPELHRRGSFAGHPDARVSGGGFDRDPNTAGVFSAEIRGSHDPVQARDQEPDEHSGARVDLRRSFARNERCRAGPERGHTHWVSNGEDWCLISPDQRERLRRYAVSIVCLLQAMESGQEYDGSDTCWVYARAHGDEQT